VENRHNAPLDLIASGPDLMVSVTLKHPAAPGYELVKLILSPAASSSAIVSPLHPRSRLKTTKHKRRFTIPQRCGKDITKLEPSLGYVWRSFG
jgi:hypothetical protein